MLRLSTITSSALVGIAAIMVQAANAQVNITIDSPGIQSSQLSNTVTETFDELAPGYYTGLSSVIGTYTGGFEVVSPNIYGGANASQYFSVGAQAALSTQSTLTFAGPQSYFGMYYQAGDGENDVQLYNGTTKVATFTTANLLTMIGGNTAYLGDPSDGNSDNSEPFAYVNFTAANPASDFTSVVFDNSGSYSTGFESDNHTILATNIGPQSTPEPGAYGMFLGLGLPAAGFLARRRRISLRNNI